MQFNSRSVSQEFTFQKLGFSWYKEKKYNCKLSEHLFGNCIAGLFSLHFLGKTTRRIPASEFWVLYMIQIKKDIFSWVKWSSSVSIIIGMVFTTFNIHPLNMYFHFFGILGWFFISVCWHDRSLIMLNGIATIIFVLGIIRSWI